MAPLTRMRAIDGDVPSPLAKTYYSQRASAGMIITEATQISPLGKGYPATPGIYSEEQTEAWKDIVAAVHAKGGLMVSQLWHVGRISHSSLHANDGLPVAPSAIAPTGKTYGADWQLHENETPKAMSEADIAQLLVDFRNAALNAKKAGFVGGVLVNRNVTKERFATALRVSFCGDVELLAFNFQIVVFLAVAGAVRFDDQCINFALEVAQFVHFSGHFRQLGFQVANGFAVSLGFQQFVIGGFVMFPGFALGFDQRFDFGQVHFNFL
jgi:hypothetical protein